MQKKKIPTHLAIKIFTLIKKERNRIPLRKRIELEASIRNIMAGKKKTINKNLYTMIFNSEYERMINGIQVQTREDKKALKRYLGNTMVKMYQVC